MKTKEEKRNKGQVKETKEERIQRERQMMIRCIVQTVAK